MNLIEIFKALGDETRFRIVGILLERELCVCEIEAILGVTQSNASRHLNKLKSSGIIVSEKKSQWVYYRISEGFITENPGLYEYLKNRAGSVEKVEADIKNLRKYQFTNFTCEEIEKDREKVLRSLED